MRKAPVSMVIPLLTMTAISGLCQGKDSGKSNEGIRGDILALKKNTGTVHVLAGVDSPDHGIFPTNIFTVPDDTQLTGLRVNMPLPDCSVRVSDCNDIALINVLDGFNIQPRVTVPFDGDIDPTTVNRSTVFFIELPGVKPEGEGVGEGQDDEGGHLQVGVVGVNQVVWDPPTHVLAVESDEQLRQHTTYAFVVTRGVLDASGAPLVAATVQPGFVDDDEDGEPPADPYSSAVWGALQTLKHSQLKLKKKDVAGITVFTTQSVTAVLEHIRDELKAATPDPATFLLGPGGSSTVFSLSDVQAIDWQQQTKVNPPAFQAFAPQYVGETKPLLLLDQHSPGAVGRIAYGTFRSPRYITDEPIMPLVGTLAGVPPVITVDTLYLNLFLPAGTPPSGGWPVVIFGVGGGDYKEESPFFYAAGFASHGIATACINVVGQGFGPLSFLKVTLKNGSVVHFPSGGRSKDLDGNGTIAGASEGVTTISPRYKTQAARDAIRQQAIDLMQLARVIEVGVDADGDGLVDLDPSQISYFGISFGAGAFGQLLMAVDPSPKSAVFASPGGLNGRFDFLRMRPSARSQVGATLAARVPSLLNSPGLTNFAGIPVGAPYFNENIPLRNQAAVTTHVDGAMDIQRFFDNVEWIAGSGDGVSYTPYIRKEPLAGHSPKALLVNFGRGDQTAPNPRGAQFVRAGGYADVTTFYRNDLAYAEDHTVNRNPHSYLQRWMLAGLSGPIGRGGIEQVATFLASGGQTIVQPEPARFFEVPISVLPEDFGYLP